MSGPSPGLLPVRYEPRNWAIPYHKAWQRFAVLVVHRRAGKSTAVVQQLQRGATDDEWERWRLRFLARYFKLPLSSSHLTDLLRHRVYGLVYPTRVQAKISVWDILKEAASYVKNARSNESELRIDYPGGHRVQLFGADEPDKLRGPAFSGLVLDEFGMQPPNVYSEVLSKNLADHLGFVTFDGTIKGKNQLYKTYEAAKSDPEWFALWQDVNVSLKTENDASILMLRQAMHDDQKLIAKGLMDQTEYDQEWFCLQHGTLIATMRGHIPIELIRTGDTVLTHRNRWRAVTDTMQRHYEGQLIEITAPAHPRPLRCTPDHRLYIHEKHTRRNTWKKACEIAIGDYLLTPKPKISEPIISEAWAKVVAWFITEGSVSGNKVMFSLNGKKQNEIDRVQSLLARVGHDSEWFNTGSGSGNLNVYSVTLADRLGAWCGNGALRKRIPFDVIGGYEQVVFEELMRGDGTIRAVQGGHTYSYSTASIGLACDVVLLAATLSRRARIEVRPAHEAVIEGRTTFCQESYAVVMPLGMKVNHARPRDAFPTKLGIAYRVSALATVPFDGAVYNLAVKEDQSYVAGGRAVHNCSVEAAIKGAYYSKQLAQMRRDGRIRKVSYDPALPVYDVWDLGKGANMAIGLFQCVAREIHMLEYLEGAESDGIEQMIAVLQRRPYVYGKHLAPHDIQATELSNGKTRAATAKNLNWEFTVVPDIGLDDGINAARLAFARLWADEEHCAGWLDAIGHYRRPWNARTQVFGEVPVHDFASHPSDMWRYCAVAEDLMTPGKAKSKTTSSGGSSGRKSGDSKLAWMGS